MSFFKLEKPSVSGYSGQDYTGLILEAVSLRFFSIKINVFCVKTNI